MRTENIESWVVYQIVIRTKPVNVVCGQDEWEELKAGRPDLYTLIRNHVRSEAEAERVARGEPSELVPPPAIRRIV